MPEFFKTNFRRENLDEGTLKRIIVKCLKPIYQEYSGVGFFF